MATISAPLMGQPLAGSACACERTAPATALSSLIARVRAARVLREHHIWEAVRILPELAGLPEDIKQSAELRRLMEKEAFAASLRLLAQSCRPARDICGPDPHGDHWVATLSVTSHLVPPRPCKLMRAEHRDPSAALLIVLLGSAAHKARPVPRRTRTKTPGQKEVRDA